MEQIDGVSLHRLLRAGAPLPPRAAIWIAREICRALDYVHALADEHGRPLGLIHRDVGPSNVLLGRNGAVKLCDFGIAKASLAAGAATASGVKGKAGYLSPEQAAGEPLDARTDLFSAGAVLFEMLTGAHPFDEDDDGTVIARAGTPVVERPARRNPDVPLALDRVCARALVRAREGRFAGAGEMAEALDALFVARQGRDELAVLLRARFPPSPPASEPTRTLAAPRRALGWSAAALLIALVAAVALWARQRRVAPWQPAAIAAQPLAAPATAAQPLAAPPTAPQPLAAPQPPAATPSPAPPAHAAAPARPPRRRPHKRDAAPPPAAHRDFMPDPFLR